MVPIVKIVLLTSSYTLKCDFLMSESQFTILCSLCFLCVHIWSLSIVYANLLCVCDNSAKQDDVPNLIPIMIESRYFYIDSIFIACSKATMGDDITCFNRGIFINAKNNSINHYL